MGDFVQDLAAKAAPMAAKAMAHMAPAGPSAAEVKMAATELHNLRVANHAHNFAYEAVRDAEGALAPFDAANRDTGIAADLTPGNILQPHNALDVHQRNYVLASVISEGHKIQAAEIHAAGFLNADDPVAISFWIISIAMVAATVFFLMEAFVLKTHWKTSLHVGALVTLVAAVHYFYMREYWVKFSQSPIVYRYIDWSITVPLQMVEFYLILSAVNPKIGGGMFWRLMLGTVAMLAFGYLGEAGAMNAWLGFALGMAGWGFILFEIFFGEAAKCAVNADKVNRHIKGSYDTMRFIVTVGWSIYPLGYFFGYLLGQWGDSPCNFTYNIADFVNKIAFCLAIWWAGKKDTIDSLGH